jgi:integrase/recombinase XerD
VAAGAGYGRSLSPPSLRGVVGYLDRLGVLARDEDPVSPVDELLDAFGRYLLQERGLAAGTVRVYARIARRFLAECSEPLANELARLSGAAVSTFVLRESRRAPRSAGSVVCGLRALLRFLLVQGLIAEPLAAAVPAVARRREDLPRGLPAGQVRRLLESCDRSTPVGPRDYAILVLLSRLGLRGGEVAALELDDLDWRTGEVVIRGKGSRIDRLPLPGDIGQALADYLRHGRPRGFGRTVFVTVCAPVTAMPRGTTNTVLARACIRAGMPAVGRIVCATPSPASCSPAARGFERLASCCVTRTSARQRSMPRSTRRRSRAWRRVSELLCVRPEPVG